MKHFKYVFLLIGTIIGSGFITGKEICSFFARYGYFSTLMVLPIFFIFFFLFELFFMLIKKNKIDFNSKYLKIFSFIIYSILAGSVISSCYEYAVSLKILPSIVIYILLIIFCVVSLMLKSNGLVKLNFILTPFLIIAFSSFTINRVVIFNLIEVSNTVYSNIISLFVNGIIYPAMNVTCCIYILKDIKKEIKNTKFISLTTSLFISLFLLLGILALNTSDILYDSNMPFIDMIGESYGVLSKIMLVVIVIACLTTLASCIFSLNKVVKLKNKFLKYVIVLFTIFIISIIGFDKIIEYLYPVIAIFGLVIIIFSLFSSNSFFNKPNSIIHKSSKNANNNYTRHN